jgi:hypothetical protein
VSGPLPVRIVGAAARAIVEAAEWWASNRPKAPAAFAEELERALDLSASQPAIGARAQNAKLAGVDAFTSRVYAITSIIVLANHRQELKYLLCGTRAVVPLPKCRMIESQVPERKIEP